MVVHVAVRGLIVFVTMLDIVVLVVAMSRIRALRHRSPSSRRTKHDTARALHSTERPSEPLCLRMAVGRRVMAGLVPAIHALLFLTREEKAWMPGTRPCMTAKRP
jgi:hypothetical protein